MTSSNISSRRRILLQRNFFSMFWLSAFMNAKMVALIATVFYLHRGLSNAEVFYTSIVWSIVILLLEIPSSYLADRWGRKKLMLVGCFLALGTLIIYLFAFGFWAMAAAVVFLAASFACFSGTDEAMIYDTGKELGESRDSFKNLGKYYSGNRIFKIFTPIIAASIANNLAAEQFNLLIYIDIATTFISTIFALRLTEPNHHLDVEKMEKGVFRDALNFFKMEPATLRAMLSRTMVFIAAFIIYRISQDYFLDIGLTLFTASIGTAVLQLTAYLGSKHIHKLEKRFSTENLINIFNLIFSLFCGIFVLASFQNLWPLLVLALYTLFESLEAIRWPIYAHYFNQKSHSYNRATTLSMTSLMKSLLDIPLLFIASVLAGYDTRWVFLFGFLLAVIVTATTWLKPSPVQDKA